MLLPKGKHIYFASDFHLGIPNRTASQERERRICRWLDSIKHTAFKIYLVGDLFDVWFEYKNVVPKGYTRFLGKLAELSDAGIHIEIFTGNHDLWMKDYFLEEMNITVHRQPITFEVNQKRFFVAHGDGLGPGDRKYKFLKSIMINRFAQWLYQRLHPDTGVALASYFSRRGQKHTSNEESVYLGDDREWLVLFAKEYLNKTHIDYFIFGHRHLAMSRDLKENSTYINLGDWLSFNTYAVFDGVQLELKKYSDE